MWSSFFLLIPSPSKTHRIPKAALGRRWRVVWFIDLWLHWFPSPMPAAGVSVFVSGLWALSVVESSGIRRPQVRQFLPLRVRSKNLKSSALIFTMLRALQSRKYLGGKWLIPYIIAHKLPLLSLSCWIFITQLRWPNHTKGHGSNHARVSHFGSSQLSEQRHHDGEVFVRR